jgi:prepilin-type N-terminal cleavage/methylation domain-containing protein
MNPTAERTDLSHEAGFTLVELLVVAALLGIVVVAISSALIVGLKTFAGTDNKVISSTDAQLVSVYLPADLQSVGTAPGSVTADPTYTTATPGGNFAVGVIGDCAPANTGTDINVLRLSWADDGGGASYVVVYRVVLSDGDWQLRRYACIDGALTADTRVARNLAGNTSADELVTVNDPQVTLQLRSKARAPGDPTNFTYAITGTRRTS